MNLIPITQTLIKHSHLSIYIHFTLYVLQKKLYDLLIPELCLKHINKQFKFLSNIHHFNNKRDMVTILVNFGSVFIIYNAVRKHF